MGAVAMECTFNVSSAPFSMYILQVFVCLFDNGAFLSAELAGEALLLSSSHKETTLVPAKKRAIPAHG